MVQSTGRVYLNNYIQPYTGYSESIAVSQLINTVPVAA